MIYEFTLPIINPHMTGARIECLYAQPGDAVKVGGKLFDVGIDLGSAFAQECPPISYFRIVSRDQAYLRKLSVAKGDQCLLGDLVALFSTEPDEDLDVPPARSIRITTAGIIAHDGMWSADNL